MCDSKRYLQKFVFLKKRKETEKKQKQKIIERKAILARYLCMEMVKRGLEIPPAFNYLIANEEEEESDRRIFV